MGRREPGRKEVLAWIEANHAGPAAAVDQFWPAAEGSERQARASKVRVWLARSGGKRKAPVDEPDESPATPAVNRPLPDYEGARLEPVAFYEREVAHLLADQEQARTSGQLRTVTTINARLADMYAELRAAKEAEGPQGEHERTPGSVATEIREADDLLRELAQRRAAAAARERSL